MLAKGATKCPNCDEVPSVYSRQNGDIVIRCITNELDEVCNQVEANTYDDAFDKWNILFETKGKGILEQIEESEPIKYNHSKAEEMGKFVKDIMGQINGK